MQNTKIKKSQKENISAILFRILEQNFPIMHHYETITLGSQETAKEIAARMRDVFVRDELLDALKAKLIAFTSDGAKYKPFNLIFLLSFKIFL